jgi:hypothetical protein
MKIYRVTFYSRLRNETLSRDVKAESMEEAVVCISNYYMADVKSAVEIESEGTEMTAEDFLKQRYEVCKGREQKWQLDDMYKFAKEAVMFARKEENDKCLRDIQSIEMAIKNNATDAFCITSECTNFSDKHTCAVNTCKKMAVFSKLIRDYKIKFETDYETE